MLGTLDFKGSKLWLAPLQFVVSGPIICSKYLPYIGVTLFSQTSFFRMIPVQINLAYCISSTKRLVKLTDWKMVFLAFLTVFFLLLYSLDAYMHTDGMDFQMEIHSKLCLKIKWTMNIL